MGDNWVGYIPTLKKLSPRHHHLFWKRSLGLDVCPYEVSLHIPEFHSGCKPRSFMSSFTHFLHVFLFLPYISSLQSPPFYRPTHFYISFITALGQTKEIKYDNVILNNNSQIKSVHNCPYVVSNLTKIEREKQTNKYRVRIINYFKRD